MCHVRNESFIHFSDSGADASDATTRQLIEDNLGKDFDLASYAVKAKRRPVKQRLFDAVETDDVSTLRRLEIAEGRANVDWDCDNGSMTLLQLAATRGSEGAVSFLMAAKR